MNPIMAGAMGVAQGALDARLIFTTDQVYPVLTGGSPASVQVLLKRVGGGQQQLQ